MAQHRPPDDDRRRVAADQRSRTRPAEPRPCRPSHQRGTGDRSEVARASARPGLEGRATALFAAAARCLDSCRGDRIRVAP
ncbi:MAG: hypothetical protein DMG18_14925, partial [Acidobacteria bacterium]